MANKRERSYRPPCSLGSTFTAIYFEIIHRPRDTNGSANALSRCVFRSQFHLLFLHPLISMWQYWVIHVLHHIFCMICNVRIMILQFLLPISSPLHCRKVIVRHVHCYSRLTHSTLTVMEFLAIYGHLANAVLSSCAHR